MLTEKAITDTMTAITNYQKDGIMDNDTADIIAESLQTVLSMNSREKIYCHDSLTTGDLAELHRLTKSQASQLMTRIKRNGDILGIKGKILVSDYLRFCGVEPESVYGGKRYDRPHP